MLLLGTCLTPPTALAGTPGADGTTGSVGANRSGATGPVTGGAGGAGGDGSVGTGTSAAGGNGGTGGQGGNGTATGAQLAIGTGGAGGVGGDGAAGTAGDTAGSSYTNGATITGGAGGSGGTGGTGGTGSGRTSSVAGTGGRGGNGAAGGAGLDASAASSITNTGTIQGGNGGAGGNGGNAGPTPSTRVGGGSGGNGGAGGVGISGNSGATIVNNGTISGGNGAVGGLGGSGVSGGASGVTGASGAGGVAIQGQNLTITNSGIITGGLGGDGVTRADAITFTGGSNVLQLQSGSTITGTVVAFSAADTLRLGGTATASFDASQIGVQYQNFGLFEKAGTGTWTLTGTSVSTAGWTVNAGTLNVTGTLNSAPLTVASGGTLSGNGTIGGLTVQSGGTVNPANSLGTLNVAGNVAFQSGSTYTVDATPSGANKIAATGTATLSGGTVNVNAIGDFTVNTTYTILTAGLVTGTFAGVSSNLAFLKPTLTYDATDVFLTLATTSASFRGGSYTGNQNVIATVLDNNLSAGGDFGTVINTMLLLDTTAGPKALNAISGQPIANFGTTNVQTGMGFMSTVGNLMGSFHQGSGGGNAQRVSMASVADDACEFSCESDASHRLAAWISGVGGLGSVQGNSNAGTLTYNFGGVAVGMDYLFAPNFRAGIGTGYTSGTQWVNGFDGRSTTDAFSGFLYASYSPSAFYVDGLAGYAYSSNRSTRTIAIPGLAPRTALGSTGANQFLGQLETGYRVDVVPSLAVTPFTRLQGLTTTQNGFTESGADSLNLTVAAQTTNSLRTTLGADLRADVARVELGLRLGWVHEFADTGRPMTASFAGAPGQAFTVTGATPQRDSAAVGFSFKTHVAEATEVYGRYDGEVGGGSDNHTFSAGLRLNF